MSGVPPIKVRGIRSPIPSGYVIGRTVPGVGDAHLIPIADFTGKPSVGGGGGGGGATMLSALTDVAVTEGAGIDGYVLYWNNGTGAWEAKAIPAGTLAALTDVSVTEGVGIDGYVLYWNNGASKWEAKAISVSVALSALTDVTITSAASGQILKWNGTKWVNVNNTGVLGCTVNGLGNVPGSGILGDLYCPWACTITGLTLQADVAGSAVFDIWKCAYGSGPPTVANTICAAALPTLSSAIDAQDNTLTGWTKTVSAGDWLRFVLNTASTLTKVTLTLTTTKG